MKKTKILSALLTVALLCSGCTDKSEDASSESSSSTSSENSENSKKPESSENNTSSDDKENSSGSDSEISDNSSDSSSIKKVTLGEAMPFKSEDVYLVGKNALVITTNEGYKFVDFNGTPIIDKVFSSAIGFFEDEYVSLDGDLYDYTGKLVEKYGISYNKGTILTEEETGVNMRDAAFSPDGSGAPVFKHTFKNAQTGGVYYSVDGKDFLDEKGCCNVGGVYSCTNSAFGKESRYVAFYMRDKTDTMIESLVVATADYGNFDIIEKLKKFENNNDIHLYSFTIMGSCTMVVEYGSIFEVQTAVIDIITGKITNCANMIFAVDYLRDNNLAIVNQDNVWKIMDMEMKNTYLDGLRYAEKMSSVDYICVTNGEKWGYFNISSHETVWFDEATTFHRETAFVIKDGKGHFIDKDFNVISDDIPATHASLYYNSIIVDDRIYPVVFPQ